MPTLHKVSALLTLVVALFGLAPTRQAGAQQTTVEKGVRVEFSVDSLAPRRGEDRPSLREGEVAQVRFRITDAETGTPISPLEPAVWISRDEGSEVISCHDRIGRYLQGMLSFQADVDLNKYFILILNNDQTISVVDPLLGVSGITQLYAMIILADRGEDWVRSADAERLYVTMPGAGEVAVVDLDSFKVVENLAAGPRPVAIALQPDGKYLWVGNDARGKEEGGVTVIDAGTHEVAATIPTGPGHHEIAFSDDSLFAFVTNQDGGTLSIIEIDRLARVRDLPVGARPVAVAFSPLSQLAYGAAEDGTITILDPRKKEAIGRLATGAGLSTLSIEPGGRWAFAANGAQGRVDVIDASNGTLVHRLAVGEKPHQLTFTDAYAYVRHLGTAAVTLIPLAQLGLDRAPGLQTVLFGDRPPGEYAFPAAADSIAPTGEWAAVVTANPADKMVYYYMEGMIAPMGSYSTYGRVPRAVGVVDRSVRETEKGLYTARFRVPESGLYNVAFVIDAPWVDHCFSFEAAADPRLAAARSADAIAIEFLTTERQVTVGSRVALTFALTRSRGGEPVTGLGDVTVLATRPPGHWQLRQRAAHLGDGRYEVDLMADEPGAYYISVAVPSLDVDFTELPFMTLLAVTESAGGERGEGR